MGCRVRTWGLIVLLLASTAWGQLTIPSLNVTDKGSDTTFVRKDSIITRLFVAKLQSATGYAGLDIFNETNKYFSADFLGASYVADSLKGRAYLGTNADQMLFTVANNYKWSFNESGTTTAMRLTSSGLYVNGTINASSMSSGPVLAVDTVKPYTIGNMLFLKDSVTVWTLDNLGATNDVKTWADCGHIMSFEGGIRVGATIRNEGYNGPAIKVDYTASMPDQFANVILSVYPGVSSIISSNTSGGPDSAAWAIYGGVDSKGKAGLGAYGADTAQGLWAGTDRITSWEPHYFKQGLYGHLYGQADTAATLQGLDTTVIKARSLSAVLNDTALGKLWLNDTTFHATGKPIVFGTTPAKDSLNRFRVGTIMVDSQVIKVLIPFSGNKISTYGALNSINDTIYAGTLQAVNNVRVGNVVSIGSTAYGGAGVYLAPGGVPYINSSKSKGAVGFGRNDTTGVVIDSISGRWKLAGSKLLADSIFAFQNHIVTVSSWGMTISANDTTKFSMGGVDSAKTFLFTLNVKTAGTGAATDSIILTDSLGTARIVIAVASGVTYLVNTTTQVWPCANNRFYFIHKPKASGSTIKNWIAFINYSDRRGGLW